MADGAWDERRRVTAPSDELIELYVSCRSWEEFVLKASAGYGLTWKFKAMFWIYRLLRNRPRLAKASLFGSVPGYALLVAGLSVWAGSAGSAWLVAAALGVGFTGFVAMAVYGASFDEFCTRVMSEEERSG